jgi:glycosyltransferase involved in cell wall biosynthesis
VSRIAVIVYETYARDSRVRRHARALVAARHEVEVLALADASSPAAAAGDGVQLIALGHKKYRGDSQRAYLAAYLAFTMRAAWAITRRVIDRRVDLVYVNNPPDFLVFAAIAARMRGIPVLLDVHDMTSDLYVAKFGRRASLSRLVSAIERASFRFADALLTIHELYAERIRAIARPGTPVAGVWNVPDGEGWLAIGDARAAEPTSGDGELRLGHHGTIVERFGIDMAIDAVAKLREAGLPVTLEILGDGDFAEAVTAQIERLALGDAVRFHRRTFSHDDLVEFTGGIDVGVAPYRPSPFAEHGLPTKVLEFLALGVPVVVTRTEMVEAHLASGVRIVSGSSVEELAGAIAEMADPLARSRLRAAGRPLAHRYGWQEQRRRLIDLVRELLQRHRPARRRAEPEDSRY